MNTDQQSFQRHKALIHRNSTRLIVKIRTPKCSDFAIDKIKYFFNLYVLN